ncbi:hypothetical protein [Acuticoccus kandeliae]|uniref:hypothetical protein n=1 Tax=Acuticoccus kandeliae TaxID=2073160 RepID=UPI000D3E80A5|nr:hypothetical protein [Acuticoccus kandeliae]
MSLVLKIIGFLMVLLSVVSFVIASKGPVFFVVPYVAGGTSLFISGILLIAFAAVLDRLRSIDRAVTAQFHLLDDYRRPSDRVSLSR